MKSISAFILILLVISISIICAADTSSMRQKSIFFEKKEECIFLPKDFLKGTANSWYQNGEHAHWKSLGYKPKSNWTHFEQQFKARFIIDREREGGPSFLLCESSPINRGEKVGISADGWNRMFDDIQLIKNLGCNAHRFEIPWTDLNPEEGIWNEEAFDLFDKYIDELRKNNIEPIVTIYHWVHPLWFEERGAWEHKENIIFFVRYAEELFKRFGHKVTYWCTINEPTVISVCGYVLGTHSPGKKDSASLLRPFCHTSLLSLVNHNYRLAGTVLANLFKAHIDVYSAIKALPYGNAAQVSIIHQAAYFNAKIKTGIAALLNPLSRKLAEHFNTYFGHQIFMTFFQTGYFTYHVPGEDPIEFIDTRAPKSLDFIGLNFYADMMFGPAPECHEHEIMTDMSMWAIRPDSLYNAIKEMSSLGVPIIITENGICDAQDDRREIWIIAYSNAVKAALDEGYDVRGYCYWSLLDNFEWNMGHNKKFGLYAVDTLSDDPAKKERSLRKGAHAYRDYVRISGQA